MGTGVLPTTVGARLRREREQRMVELEDIAAALYVPASVLSDIEAGQVETFDQPLHWEAHVRLYARELGLDPAELLKDPPLARKPPAWRMGGIWFRRTFTGAGAGTALALLVTLLVGTGWSQLKRDEHDHQRQEDHEVQVLARDEGNARTPDGPVLREPAGVERPSASREPSGSPPEGSLGREGSRSAPSRQQEAQQLGEPVDRGRVPEEVPVQVLDGSAEAERLNAAIEDIDAWGYDVVFVDVAASSYEGTVVMFVEGAEREAVTLAERTDWIHSVEPSSGMTAPADLHVIVGSDWPIP